MKKYVILCLLICQSLTTVQAKLDLIEFDKKIPEGHDDIAYIHFVPEYEENMDPKRAVSIEVYFGELDDTEESHKRLSYMKSIVDDDLPLMKEKNRLPEISAISNRDDVLNSKKLELFLDKLGLDKKGVKPLKVPQSLDFVSKYKKNETTNKRVPSSKFLSERVYWTIIRATTSGGGVFLGLKFIENLPITLASTLSIWPAIGSGAFIYFNSQVGNLTKSGAWSRWLLFSDHSYAEKFRKTFGLNPEKFHQSLLRDQEYIRAQYPSLYKENQELMRLAEEGITNNKKLREARLSKLYRKFLFAEEYLKFYLFEVAFVAVTLKTPQIIAGIGDAFTLSGFASDVFGGSLSGLLAQAPGEIAIHTRKFQMVEELKADILNSKIQIDNQAELLEEIDKVLAKEGKHASYAIHDGSHELLRKIEAIARRRATLLSFFSVTGVSMKIFGIAGSTPLLMGIGVFGATYYAHTVGWIKIPFPNEKIKTMVHDIRSGGFKHFMRMIKIRQCENRYLLTPPRS